MRFIKHSVECGYCGTPSADFFVDGESAELQEAKELAQKLALENARWIARIEELEERLEAIRRVAK